MRIPSLFLGLFGLSLVSPGRIYGQEPTGISITWNLPYQLGEVRFVDERTDTIRHPADLPFFPPGDKIVQERPALDSACQQRLSEHIATYFVGKNKVRDVELAILEGYCYAAFEDSMITLRTYVVVRIKLSRQNGRVQQVMETDFYYDQKRPDFSPEQLEHLYQVNLRDAVGTAMRRICNRYH